MSVVVTGGAGYIGAHVLRALEDLGEAVVAVDDLSTGLAGRVRGVRLVELDVARDDAVEALADLLVASDASSVIHFAAKKQAGESVIRPTFYYKENVGGLANVLESMERAGVRRLVFSSSAAVYGTAGVSRVNEYLPPVPINPYGETKLVGEWLARAAGAAWGLQSVALRYFNVAGAGSPDLGDLAVLNLVTMVLDRLSRGEAPRVFGDDYPTPDGTCVRDYVHVQDIAMAHVAAMRFLEGQTGRVAEVFNVGTGTGASVLQVLDAIREASRLDFPTEVTDRRAGDPPSVVAATEKIESVLGWHAQYGLHQIIQSAWVAWQTGPRAIAPVGASPWEERALLAD